MSSVDFDGILPAAGKASRLGGLPKYLLPVPGGHLMNRHVWQMEDAGVEDIWVGCSLDGDRLISVCAPHTSRYQAITSTMSETVLMAREHVGDHNVLFGMPDTYWTDDNVYGRLKAMLANDIDVAVACWRVRPEQIGHVGQIYFNGLTRVQTVVDKDPECKFPWAWGAIAWNAKFWDCIDPSTPHVGYAIAEAVKRRLHVFALPLDGLHFNIGTLSEYYACLQSMEGELA